MNIIFFQFKKTNFNEIPINKKNVLKISYLSKKYIKLFFAQEKLLSILRQTKRQSYKRNYF